MERKNLWGVSYEHKTLTGEPNINYYITGESPDEAYKNAKRLINQLPELKGYSINSLNHVGQIYE